jgi:uncharacterized membrane protein
MWIVKTLWTTVILLAIVGVAAVIRRVLVLFWPLQFNGHFASAQALDSNFARHPALTLAHIVPGFLFMILGPLQFIRGIRSRWLWLHRWSGRVFVAAGLVIGAAALVMSFRMAIGGANETAATTLFALIFLFDLSKAPWHIRRREIARHREWMIRAFAVGLAVATIHPIIGAFFATAPLTHLTAGQFFGAAFWIGFTLHLIAAEAWINYARPTIAAPLIG